MPSQFSMITAHYVDLFSSITYQLLSFVSLFLYVGIPYPTGKLILLGGEDRLGFHNSEFPLFLLT